ncbi:MAG TPA: GIY-YIG nuclease family protein [Planctomycetes bacterium]|nr:GIY-YIG nuclease family protein [Fuerstiella sp.]HIK91157.1 GIY-YIG nuclease family protein [Planctomycetota bacterium]
MMESQEVWFVYIVRCSDGSLYTGITKDVEGRLKRHNAGTASRYTRSRLPVTVEYHEEQPNHSMALKRELAIKALSRQMKEKLLQSDQNGREESSQN